MRRGEERIREKRVRICEDYREEMRICEERIRE